MRVPLLVTALIAVVANDRLPSKDPALVGMSPERLAAIDRIVRRGIDAGGYPGAALMIGRDGYVVFDRGYGRLEWKASSPAVSTDSTMYDIASMTKVIALTAAAMVLFDDGKLPLDAPVQRFLPEFKGRGKEKVTIRMLLSHHSGLPPGRKLWGRTRSPAHARQLILETPLTPCGAGPCLDYSDLGTATLGWAIEKIAGEPLDAFVTRRVFAPLKMASTLYKPAASLRPRIAPAERYSKRGFIHGVVHDDAGYLLGGVAGHAGLFSTAEDLAVFAQTMLNGGELNGTRVFAESTVRIFTAHQKHSRTLGWELADSVHGAGFNLSMSAYGHTGYTGTSIWIDPEQRTYIVLLTNRTYEPKALRSQDLLADVRNDVADATMFSITSDRAVRVPQRIVYRSDTARTWNLSRRPAWRDEWEKRKPTTNRPPAVGPAAPGKTTALR